LCVRVKQAARVAREPGVTAGDERVALDGQAEARP
jgi:hypothetical protein